MVAGACWGQHEFVIVVGAGFCCGTVVAVFGGGCEWVAVAGWIGVDVAADACCLAVDCWRGDRGDSGVWGREKGGDRVDCVGWERVCFALACCEC